MTDTVFFSWRSDTSLIWTGTMWKPHSDSDPKEPLKKRSYSSGDTVFINIPRSEFLWKLLSLERCPACANSCIISSRCFESECQVGVSETHPHHVLRAQSKGHGCPRSGTTLCCVTFTAPCCKSPGFSHICSAHLKGQAPTCQPHCWVIPT